MLAIEGNANQSIERDIASLAPHASRSPAARENARLKLHFMPSPPASRENKAFKHNPCRTTPPSSRQKVDDMYHQLFDSRRGSA